MVVAGGGARWALPLVLLEADELGGAARLEADRGAVEDARGERRHTSMASGSGVSVGEGDGGGQEVCSAEREEETGEKKERKKKKEEERKKEKKKRRKRKKGIVFFFFWFFFPF